MTKFYKICGLVLGVAVLASCVEIDNDYRRRTVLSEEPDAAQSTQNEFAYTAPQAQNAGYADYSYAVYSYADDYSYPECEQETIVVVYDDAGAYQVPGCIMDSAATPAETPVKEDDEEINPDEIEGDFPYVVDNKHPRKQVVMQNLQTRVLAYCRGDDNAINDCISRLECAGYTQLRNVPTMPAKYDKLRKGSYPTRRWREGETVPRW